MKFKMEYIADIENETILEIVNQFQDAFSLEYFKTLEECPFELIIIALDEVEIFDDELDYANSYDFIISKVE